MMDAPCEHFDYIIVDTPPPNSVIDAAIIAQRCGWDRLITELRQWTQGCPKGEGTIRTNIVPLFLGENSLNNFNMLPEYGFVWWIWIFYGEYGKSKE